MRLSVGSGTDTVSLNLAHAGQTGPSIIVAIAGNGDGCTYGSVAVPLGKD